MYNVDLRVQVRLLLLILIACLSGCTSSPVHEDKAPVLVPREAPLVGAAPSLPRIPDLSGAIMPPPPPSVVQVEAQAGNPTAARPGSEPVGGGAPPAGGGAAPAGGAAPPEAPPYSLQTVYFATDRNLLPNAMPTDFGAKSADNLSYGSCVVSIPAGHKAGNMEMPQIWKGQFKADPTRHMVLLDVQKMDVDRYLAEIRGSVAHAPSRELFVFVHGYNVSFSDAARRTAQMAYDLHFQGAPIFYSWPSQGKTQDYPADEDSARRTQLHLQAFLLDIAGKTGAENIYLIAHSMGNRPLTEALAAISKTGRRLDGQVKELILAAPDIDATIFKQQIAPFLANAAQGITLYVSDKDKALMASAKVHKDPRAGQARSLVVLTGMDTIDASLVDTDFLGHSYFVQNRALLTDMAYIFSNHFRADKRAGLHRISREKSIDYWQFDR